MWGLRVVQPLAEGKDTLGQTNNKLKAKGGTAIR